jgi:predicted dehydrogenase
MNWILEDRVERVASFGGLNFFLPENRHRVREIAPDANGVLPYHSWLSDRDENPFTSHKSIVDNQVAILQFSGGVRATFHTNLNAGQPERRLYLLGTTGSIRADVLTGELRLRRIGFETEEEDLATGVSGMHGGGDPVLCEHLAVAMRTGRVPLTGLREGVEAAVVCLGVDQSRVEGQVVDLSRIWRTVDERLPRYSELKGGDGRE